MQAWALNRYYYQAMIPIKDASLIARCEDPATRREWRSRLVDHDGEQAKAKAASRAGSSSPTGSASTATMSTSLRGLLPATRFAVDAYVRFVREKTLLEAIASSLTELFSPEIIGERMEGMLKNYDFVTARDARLFLASARRRPSAMRDFALDYVKRHARTRGEQQAGAGGARIQMRRAVGDARRALSCLCGAEADSARRLRAGRS